MPNPSLVRWAGVALGLGGALTLLLNAFFTPLLPGHLPMGEVAALPIFAWRQGASAAAAAMLLFGSIGLYLRQSHRAGWWGLFWFTAAFLGSALLLGHEWGDVFFLRALALRAPQDLRPLDTGSGFGLYDVGAMIALGVFTVGWIGFAGWTIRAGVLSRRGAILLIAGFFVAPLAGALLHAWGAVLGNAILGAGWYWLGYEVTRRDQV